MDIKLLVSAITLQELTVLSTRQLEIFKNQALSLFIQTTFLNGSTRVN